MVANQLWVQVKNPVDITLDGVTVELDWTDTSTINSIIVRDNKGNALRTLRASTAGCAQ